MLLSSFIEKVSILIFTSSWSKWWNSLESILSITTQTSLDITFHSFTINIQNFWPMKKWSNILVQLPGKIDSAFTFIISPWLTKTTAYFMRNFLNYLWWSPSTSTPKLYTWDNTFLPSTIIWSFLFSKKSALSITGKGNIFSWKKPFELCSTSKIIISEL